MTVVSAEEPDGIQLVLEPNYNPSAREYQEAIYKQGIRAATFFVDHAQKEFERLSKLGATFTMKPTKVTGVDHCHV